MKPRLEGVVCGAQVHTLICLRIGAWAQYCQLQGTQGIPDATGLKLQVGQASRYKATISTDSYAATVL